MGLRHSNFQLIIRKVPSGTTTTFFSQMQVQRLNHGHEKLETFFFQKIVCKQNTGKRCLVWGCLLILKTLEIGKRKYKQKYGESNELE